MDVQQEFDVMAARVQAGGFAAEIEDLAARMRSGEFGPPSQKGTILDRATAWVIGSRLSRGMDDARAHIEATVIALAAQRLVLAPELDRIAAMEAEAEATSVLED